MKNISENTKIMLDIEKVVWYCCAYRKGRCNYAARLPGKTGKENMNESIPNDPVISAPVFS